MTLEEVDEQIANCKAILTSNASAADYTLRGRRRMAADFRAASQELRHWLEIRSQIANGGSMASLGMQVRPA